MLENEGGMIEIIATVELARIQELSYSIASRPVLLGND